MSMRRSDILTFCRLFVALYVFVEFGYCQYIDSNIWHPQSSQRIRYDRHKLVQVRPVTASQVYKLQDFGQKNTMDIDYWTEAALNHSLDIRVSPINLYPLIRILNSYGLDVNIAVNDLQVLIDEENVMMSGNLLRGGPNSNDEDEPVVGRYIRYDQMMAWMRGMALRYPNMAQFEDIGISYERRNIRLMKLGVRSSSMKPIIFIEAGSHAREWIGPALTIYIIDTLLKQYNSDSSVWNLMNKYDWYILPLGNPDGYEYSHTIDRFWRKNRRRSSISSCVGVDVNRNWGINFGGAATSTNPCHEYYGGSHSFSELESVYPALQIWKERHRVKVFISLHSYSQFLLVPYAYSLYRPPDDQELRRVAQIAASALRSRHGTIYDVGTAGDLLYSAAGTSFDWAKAVANVKYSYSYELVPRCCKGAVGFLVPERDIVRAAEEFWDSVKAIASNIIW